MPRDRIADRRDFRGSPPLRTVAAALVLIAVLVVAKEIFIPVALAGLAATLLGPIVGRLDDRIGRPAASVVAVTLALGLCVGAAYFVGVEVAALARELPDYTQNIAQKLSTLSTQHHPTIARLERALAELSREIGPPQPEVPAVRIVEPTSSLLSRLAPLGVVLEEIVTAVLVVVLVFFLLLHAETLREKIVRLLGRTNVAVTTRALSRAGARIGRYLLLQSVVNAAVGIVVTGLLFLLGIPQAFLWGAITAILRFVPYVGTAVAATLPTAVAFAVTPGWLTTILVPVLCLGTDVFAAYVVEPVWIGHRMGVSPVALLISAVVWTWMWGPVGLILATPIAVSLQVIGETVPSLGFLDVIFGPTAKLEPHLRFFGRLVRGDAEAARALAEDMAAERGLEPLCAEVLAPALAELDRARAAGRVDETTARAAEAFTRELIERAGPFRARPDGARVAVVVAPGERRDLEALMLAQILRARGDAVAYVGPEAAPEEIGARLAAAGAQVVIVFVAHEERIGAALEAIARARGALPGAGLVAFGPAAGRAPERFAEAGAGVAARFAAARRVVERVERRARQRAGAPRPPPERPQGREPRRSEPGAA